MIRNYFKVAFRAMKRQAFYTSINLFGLTLGISCCLLIFLFVKDELSYDRFHEKGENIYRIGLRARFAGQELSTANTSLAVGPTLLQEVPGIEAMVRVDAATTSRSPGVVFRNGDKIFSERNIFWADSGFFDLFSFELVAGDKRTSLMEPNSVVLSEALAMKYFDGDALGKTMTIGRDNETFTVTGIAREAPSNSHIHYNAILSFSTVLSDSTLVGPNWLGNSYQTYVLKNRNTSVQEIDEKLKTLVATHVGAEMEQYTGSTYSDFVKNGGYFTYFLYPLADSHLRMTLPDDFEPGGNIQYVYTFTGIGVFILLLACINFMNMSTARSFKRAKEVGLRKTLGSSRLHLTWQFFSESFAYTLLAFILSGMVCVLILPYFNTLAGKQLLISDFFDPIFVMGSLLLLLSTALLAGSYSALYIPSFGVVEVLKGKLKGGMKSKGMRSTLVVFQFSISILLLIATAVVFLQLDYLQKKDIGFDRENVLVVHNTARLPQNGNGFREAIRQLANVEVTSFTSNMFPGVNNTTVFRKQGSDVDFLTGLYSADWDHAEAMNFTLKEGRFFSRDFPSDSTACILNEAAVRQFEWTEAVGKTVVSYDEPPPVNYTVVGVVKDFNFESLKVNVRPMIIVLQDGGRNLFIRYTGSPVELVNSVRDVWAEFVPGDPIEYSFLDESFNTLFKNEVRLRQLFSVFSVLSIIIGCLGLSALAAFVTEQRTKEIGIRKSVGASVSSVAFLLAKEFIRLVLIASFFAMGVGWFVSTQWLSEFPDRIGLHPLIFVSCALLAILIAGLTVGYHSIRAALAKPVDSLRYE